MFLTKVRQSYCYTKLCNYIEEFLLKPVSSIANILVFQLSFTRLLNVFYFQMDG